jgi:glycosyltransferase involved in cell wall biosynthesis
MPKLTAIIPTYNEQDNIAEAIACVSFADEILIVDSFSTDNTLSIATQFEKVKIIQREYGYSASQKNWAIPQATHEWILLLDADERITEALKIEILKAIQQPEAHVAYWITRSNIFMGKPLKYVWKNDSVIRLFKRDFCRYEDKNVHAEIIAKGSVGKLSNVLIHDTYQYKGLENHLLKNYRYSTWAAYDKLDKTRNVSLFHLAIKPIAAFLKRYIVQLGFLDGKPGFIISVFGAWGVFLRYVKIWRIQQGEKIERK